MMVFLVDFEMFVKIVDPVSKDGDLNFRGTGVAFFELIIFDYLFFDLFGYHFLSPFLIRLMPCAASECRHTEQKVKFQRLILT